MFLYIVESAVRYGKMSLKTWRKGSWCVTRVQVAYVLLFFFQRTLIGGWRMEECIFTGEISAQNVSELCWRFLLLLPCSLVRCIQGWATRFMCYFVTPLCKANTERRAVTPQTNRKECNMLCRSSVLARVMGATCNEVAWKDAPNLASKWCCSLPKTRWRKSGSSKTAPGSSFSHQQLVAILERLRCSWCVRCIFIWPRWGDSGIKASRQHKLVVQGRPSCFTCLAEVRISMMSGGTATLTMRYAYSLLSVTPKCASRGLWKPGSTFVL